MNLIALSAFANNYNIWMFHDGRSAVVPATILGACLALGRARTSERIRSEHEDELPMPPSSIDRGRCIDSFLRCDETAVAQAARSHGAASDEPVAVLTALRQWKNDFR